MVSDRRTRGWCLFGVLLLFALEAAASRVFYKSLNEVLPHARNIVVARVDRVSLDNPVRYEVTPLRVLLGSPSARYDYVFPAIERKQPDGSVLRISPILDGSGQERNVKAGELWIFLSSLPEHAIRVEPLASEGAIADWLKSRDTRTPAP